MTEREKFEKWFKDYLSGDGFEDEIDKAIEKDPLGDYKLTSTFIAFDAYQAATKAAVPNVIFQLSSDAKDSLCAMLEYCLENGIGMGMDEGIMDFHSGDKHSFRLELEALCDSLAAAPDVKDEY